MRKNLILVFCLIATLIPQWAFSEVGVGSSFGFHEKTQIASVYGNIKGSVFSERFKIGVGLRHTSFIGSEYKTTANQPNSGGKVTIKNPRIHAYNLVFFSSFFIGSNWSVGFNLDLIGISHGPRKDEGEFSNGLEGRPTKNNVFKGGSKDDGTLNSEFWVGYNLNSDWLLKAGFAHFVAEYKTTQAQADGTQRFRKFNNFIFIGINYSTK